MTGTATGEGGSLEGVDIFTNISGVILDSGSTGTMNAGTINISHYAGEQDTSNRSTSAGNNASYGVVNNGTFSMYAGEIINNAEYYNRSTSNITLPARGIAGNNTPTITGGNINSSVTSNRSGATNMAINANQYIDANNTLSLMLKPRTAVAE